jgi:hypothetical protein
MPGSRRRNRRRPRPGRDGGDYWDPESNALVPGSPSSAGYFGHGDLGDMGGPEFYPDPHSGRPNPGRNHDFTPTQEGRPRGRRRRGQDYVRVSLRDMIRHGITGIHRNPDGSLIATRENHGSGPSSRPFRRNRYPFDYDNSESSDGESSSDTSFSDDASHHIRLNGRPTSSNGWRHRRRGEWSMQGVEAALERDLRGWDPTRIPDFIQAQLRELEDHLEQLHSADGPMRGSAGEDPFSGRRGNGGSDELDTDDGGHEDYSDDGSETSRASW